MKRENKKFLLEVNGMIIGDDIIFHVLLFNKEREDYSFDEKYNLNKMVGYEFALLGITPETSNEISHRSSVAFVKRGLKLTVKIKNSDENVWQRKSSLVSWTRMLELTTLTNRPFDTASYYDEPFKSSWWN